MKNQLITFYPVVILKKKKIYCHLSVIIGIKYIIIPFIFKSILIENDSYNQKTYTYSIHVSKKC